MEDRGLRDIERWRDKIEVRLDNRQVFFLFFGSALVACMLFVLGVIVGKRLESRGRAVSPEIEDPLALLDKVATTPRAAQTGVTFPQALFGGSGKSAASDKHAKKALPQSPALALPALATDRVEAAKDAVKTVALVEPAKPAPATSRPAVVVPAVAEPKIAPAKVEPKAQAKVAETASEPKPVENSAKAKVAEAKEDKPAAIPTIAAGETKGKARYALQLSSFQDKGEAEAFAQKFEGERPYLVVSEIPGKGTWFRVRVGDYATSKDAVAAKQGFERKHNVIAYVSQK
jgi:septal ring-binding cell division protein DamX